MIRYPRLCTCLVMLCILLPGAAAHSQEVIVLSRVQGVIDWMKAEQWWGEENRDEQLMVPHTMLTGINPAWRETAQQLPVRQKKEIFYRFMLPLILHANDMVMDRRAGLIRMQAMLEEGEQIPEQDMEALREGAVLLRIASRDEAALLEPGRSCASYAVKRPAVRCLGRGALQVGYHSRRACSGTGGL
jgi:hypothetical protein